MSQRKLMQISEEEYDQFINTQESNNFLNSIYAGKKLTIDGWHVEYVGLKEENNVVGAALLISRNIKVGNYFYAPRGFVIDFKNEELVKDFVTQLKAYLKSNKGVYLKIDPYVFYQVRDKDGVEKENAQKNDLVIALLKSLGFEHDGFTVGYDESRQCRWMSVLFLDGKTKEQALKEMNSQTRQNIKNTIKNGIKVCKLAYDELHILDEIVNATSERRGFSNLSLDYYQNEYKAFGEHACAYYAYLDLDDYYARIVSEREKEEETIRAADEVLKDNPHSKNSTSRKKTALQHLESLEKREQDYNELKKDFDHEVPLAASLFIMYGKEIIYLTSGSYDQYKRFKGPYALQWYMIQKAIDEGYSMYNFYGISGYFEKDQDGFGVFDFKRGFNAEIVELIGDFTLPISSTKLALYNALKKVKH